MHTQIRTTTPDPAPAAREPRPTQAADRAERPGPVLTPRVDIYEGEADVLLYADLPGVAAGDVHLDYDRGQLTLTASTTDDHPLGAVRWERTFLVPRTIQPDGITAELKEGVLKVRLPRQPQLRKRSVEVAVG